MARILIEISKKAEVDSLSTSSQVYLASLLADYMYNDFKQRFFSTKGVPNFELLCFIVSNRLGEKFNENKNLSLSPEVSGQFRLFLDQSSGFSNLSIKELLSECDAFNSAFRENFASTRSHVSSILSPMLSLSVSLFLLSAIVNDGAEFPNYPRVYSQLSPLVTIPEIPHSYQSYLKSFLNSFYFHLEGLDFWQSNRIHDLFKIPSPIKENKMLIDDHDTLKLNIIMPIDGKEPKLKLSSFLTSKYLLELPQFGYLVQIDKPTLDQGQEKYALEHGLYFIIENKPSFIIILNHPKYLFPETPDLVDSDLKALLEMLKQKSSLLKNFLSCEGIGLYEISA